VNEVVVSGREQEEGRACFELRMIAGVSFTAVMMINKEKG